MTTYRVGDKVYLKSMWGEPIDEVFREKPSSIGEIRAIRGTSYDVQIFFPRTNEIHTLTFTKGDFDEV